MLGDGRKSATYVRRVPAEATFRRSDDVVFEIAGGRAVILDGDGRTLTTLNRVGTHVWKLLDVPRDAHDIARALQAAFTDVPPTTLERDARQFLHELREANLVVVERVVADAHR
jgi:hypothetical protein